MVNTFSSNRLKTRISRLELKNPTILASGILDISSGLMRKVASAGVGGIVTKSIGLKSREGYPNPTIISIECGLLNAVGLANPGIDEFIKEIDNLGQIEVPLILSIYGFSSDEFVNVAKRAVDSVADAVELNLSCPHVRGAGTEIGQNPRLVSEVVSKVKKVSDKPVLAKLTPNVAEIADLAKAAVSGGADAIVAVNTLKAMAIDVETCKPILANRIGGLSGGAIKPVAVRCVYEIYDAVDVPIIGCGGIRTWQDAVEHMLAGASAVQIGSAIAYEDLSVFENVAKGIDAYLKRKGFRSVEEIVGLAHQH